MKLVSKLCVAENKGSFYTPATRLFLMKHLYLTLFSLSLSLYVAM